MVLAETLRKGMEVPGPGSQMGPKARLGKWVGRLLSLGLNSLQKMAARWPSPKSSAGRADPTPVRPAR